MVDTGLVTLALVNVVSHTWINGDNPFDVTAIIQELVNAFSIDNVEMFVDDHNERSNWMNYAAMSGVSLMIDYSLPVPPAPSVLSVTPNTGIQGATILGVAIGGAHFTGATSVSFGAGITVSGLDVVDDSHITVDIAIASGAVLGARDVSVTSPDGTGTLTDGFTVLTAAPLPTSATPNSGHQGATIASDVIAGSNFTGATVVSYGAGITVNSFTVDNDNQITANITIANGAAVGARDISVTNSYGTGTLLGGFTILSGVPTVTTQPATSVGKTVATLNGNVTAINDTVITNECFVWDTSPHGDPGDVAPSLSGYPNWCSSGGSFGTGPFSTGLSGLTPATIYYYRAYALGSNGHYGYGAEVSVHTLGLTTFSLLGWFTGASIGGNQNIGQFQGSIWVEDSVPPSGIITISGQLQNVRLQLTDDPVMISTPVTYTLRRSYLDVNHVIQTVDLLHLDFYANEKYHEDLATLCEIQKGDILSWYVPCAQNGQFSWSADFTPLTDGYFPMSQGYLQAFPPSYSGLLGGSGGTLEQSKTTMVHTGQMKYFAAMTGWTGGGSDTTDLTLMKNGVSTSVTFHGVPVAQGHNDVYYDDTTVIDFVPGDQFWWEATASGGSPPGWPYFGFCFIGMDYEVYLLTRGMPGFNTIPTRAEIEVNACNISWVDASIPGNEVCITPYDCYPNTICLKCKTAPGVGKSWTLTLYTDGNPTGLSVTVSGNDTFGIATHPVSWRAKKNAYFVLTPSGSPALDYVSAGLILGRKPVSALGGNAAKLLAAAVI